MKLYCPKCSHNVNIGSSSRFRIFECDNCSTPFRGIHADVNRANAGVRIFMRAVIPAYHHLIDKDALNHYETNCPYCWEIIPLAKSKSKGYIAPQNCWSCCKDLPNGGPR